MVLRRYGAVLIFFVVALMIISGCTPGKSMLRDRNNANAATEVNYDNNEFNFNDNQPQDVQVYSGSQSNKGQIDQKLSHSEQYGQRYPQTNNAVNPPAVSVPVVNNTEKKNETDFFETGPASWYGREFHGKTTASGEKFNMYEYTAAHKTIPFGSIVEVKNLENGKSVKVKINDRGPYRGKRIVDLSYGAAKEVGIISSGTCIVGIKVLEKGDGKYSSGNEKKEAVIRPVVDDLTDKDSSGRIIAGNYAVQAGAFYSRGNAEKLKVKLEKIIENPVEIAADGDFYKVRIKGLVTRSEAEKFKRILHDENINSFVVNGCE